MISFEIICPFLQTENGGSVQRNSGQYYYNIPPPNRSNESYSMNSNHTTNYASPPTHNYSLSHSHPHSSPPMMTHSHSNSASQIGMGHTHNRNTMNHNGHSHSNSHGGNSGQNSNSANSGHNREPSGLDLAGSREQRGSAFELYRKPLHHHNMR